MHRRKFLSMSAAAVPALAVASAQSSPTPPQTGQAVTPVSRGADIFLSHRIGTDHAEAVSVMDVNGDGRPDIISGAYWYENPGPLSAAWKRHQFRDVTVAPFHIAGESKIEFVSDSVQFLVDVNHDGALDLVTAGWQADGVWWYENPKNPSVYWKSHYICHSKATEGMAQGDINGDGAPDLIMAHYEPSNLIWINFAGREPVVHNIGGKAADGHGVGIADLTGNGKADILTVHGWLENVDADHDKWNWHPDWELSEAGFPIIGHDVNGDGKMDIIFSHGHNFGLYWLEQKISGGRRTWERHLIDDSFSEVHALNLVDIDGDGEPELIAGKRYRADPDPGLYDPLCIFYYKLDRRTTQFTRFPISYNGTAGIGTQIIVTDLDGDGDQDIVVAGKTGVHWLENLRVDKVPSKVREQELWLNVNWPFAGESGPNSPAGHEFDSASIVKCE
ncbi:MAG: FG-GAP repeat domain-containing protein [Terriglobia bacterium]